jgi:hypothetical protein
MTTWWLTFLGVAVAMAVTDVCWSKYVSNTAAGRRLPAAAWSAGIVLCGSVTICAYVSDPRFVVAAMIGAFVGTYLSVQEIRR